MAGLVTRTDQVTALVLVPFVIIVHFAVTTAFHDVVESSLKGLSGGDGFFGLDFVVTLLSIGFFVAGFWFIFWWVRNGGPGILR